MAALIVFLVSCLLILYVYVGYPLLITVWARQRTKLRQMAVFPRVTLVFCAHNEEAVLPEKIANCGALDYPASLLEFCVGSDGSTDGTNALLQAWAADPRVRLLLNANREGKTMLLNRIVPTAKGDVVLFSDASTLFTPEAVRRHVDHYADPRVGCVGGDLDFVNIRPLTGEWGAWSILALRKSFTAMRIIVGHFGLCGRRQLFYAAGTLADSRPAFC